MYKSSWYQVSTRVLRIEPVNPKSLNHLQCDGQVALAVPSSNRLLRYLTAGILP